MVRAEKIEKILANLKGFGAKLTRLASLGPQEFLSDFTKVESVKHLFQGSVECCIDLANHLISSQRFRAPKTYGEEFEILAEQGIIEKAFLPTLRQMVQFRNRLVHLYWEVDAQVIYDILQNNLEDFERFTKEFLPILAGSEQSKNELLGRARNSGTAKTMVLMVSRKR